MVTPDYMIDDPELTKNYKTISIADALWNVFKKNLYKQIKEYSLSQTLLSNTQFGFRTSCSTIDTIFFCLVFSENQLIAMSFFAAHN